MNEHATIAQPVAKVISVWGIVSFTSWADAASFLAFCYSAILIGEWAWKRIIRPFLERRGYVK